MSRVSEIVVVERANAPGQFFIIRQDNPDQVWIWCGKALGWMPFDTTSPAFFHQFDSEEEASAAGDKYVNEPLRKWAGTN